MNMNKRLKALTLSALAVLTLGLGAMADPNTTNDRDSLTLRITPNVDLGVDIDTTTAKFTGGTAGLLDIALALNATGFLISPASVTVLGNFNNQEVEVIGQSLDTWTLDADEAIGADSLQVYALFANNKSSAPVEGEFGVNGVNNLVTTVARIAGQPAANEATPGSNNSYELDSGMDGFTNMDNMTVGTLKQLWLRLDTPSTTTSDADQRVTITLTAKNGVTN